VHDGPALEIILLVTPGVARVLEGLVPLVLAMRIRYDIWSNRRVFCEAAELLIRPLGLDPHLVAHSLFWEVRRDCL